MEHIILEAIRAMNQGTARVEAINDAANFHATSYYDYLALYRALDAAVPHTAEK